MPQLTAHVWPAQWEGIIETTIMRFPAGMRDLIVTFALGSYRRAQLVVSRPGTAFAIATGCGGVTKCARALEMIDAGEKIEAINGLLAIPRYFSRLPPEAFRKPIRHIPNNPQFNEVLNQNLPPTPALASGWLERLQIADLLGDPALVRWFARLTIPRDNDGTNPGWKPLAFLAWLSERPHLPAADLVKSPWNDTMPLKHAIASLRSFDRALARRLRLSGAGLQDCWVAAGRTARYLFEPIRTAQQLDHVAATLRNCAAGFDVRLAIDHCRLFAIHDALHGGKLVGLLELRPSASAPDQLFVNERKLYRRGLTLKTLDRHIAQWLSAQDGLCGGSHTTKLIETEEHRATLRMLFGDYVEARPIADWIDWNDPRNFLTDFHSRVAAASCLVPTFDLAELTICIARERRQPTNHPLVCLPAVNLIENGPAASRQPPRRAVQ